MRSALICLLVLASMLCVRARDCNDNSVSVYVTDEGNIRWKFSRAEMLSDGGPIHTICGLKCDCFNKVYLCCSDVECIHMDHQCSPEQSGGAQTFEDAFAQDSDQAFSDLSESFVHQIPHLSDSEFSESEEAKTFEDAIDQGSDQESSDLSNNFLQGIPKNLNLDQNIGKANSKTKKVRNKNKKNKKSALSLKKLLSGSKSARVKRDVVYMEDAYTTVTDDFTTIEATTSEATTHRDETEGLTTTEEYSYTTEQSTTEEHDADEEEEEEEKKEEEGQKEEAEWEEEATESPKEHGKFDTAALRMKKGDSGFNFHN